MKKSAIFRFSITLFLLISLMSPAAVLAAGDGKKHFKRGLQHEYAEEWDKAVDEFMLAVADNPRNPEYRLHLIRALFNASQLFMKQGKALADQEDYAGAYNSFRRAYGYDPVNELAKSEMERMVRLQKTENNGGVDPDAKNPADGVKLVQTSFNGVDTPKNFVIPQQLENLRTVPFPNPVDLVWLIKELSKDLDLNVLFDQGSRLDTRKAKLELKNVTSAKALDYLFLQENLFFQKVGPRTILIAESGQRQRFQQLVLRTFYLANANPKDVEKVVKTAIPAQPGRTPTIVLIDEPTNSITIRDTSENIRLIGKLISSLDKDRAEVVMDVQIFEVSKADLLQFGNQIGNTGSLVNLGGTTSGVVGLGGNDAGRRFATLGRNLIDHIPTAFGAGLILPAANLSALQSKTNTKLLASTQIHAFNNEDSSARIGQRVPVQTASVLPFGTSAGGGTTPGNAFGNGFPVINYEQVGLTLKFKPLVFPNQDVQVTMEIESKDRAAGGADLTPVFTERTIKGTARIQNNKTLLLASVAQGVESDGRAGIPFLSSLPIIGRLFVAPKKENSQVDIVIAVTPRVIRAPAILPEDLEERETGSLAVPTSSSLEAMMIQEEIDDQLAIARRLGNTAQIQLPDQTIDQPVYVKSAPTDTLKAETPVFDPGTIVKKINADSIKGNTLVQVSDRGNERIQLNPVNLTDTKIKSEPSLDRENDESKQISSPLKTLEIDQTSEKPQDPKFDQRETNSVILSDQPFAELQLLSPINEMAAGEKMQIAVLLRSPEAFRSAVLGLKFDPKKLSVKNIRLGEVFGSGLALSQVTPFVNQGGKTYMTLSVSEDIAANSSGVLAYIEIEALTSGTHEIAFDRDMVNFMTAKGRNFSIRY